MRVYRVSYQAGGKQKGYEFFDKAVVAHAAVANAKARKLQAEIDVYELPTNKEGLIRALNQFGRHPDNG